MLHILIAIAIVAATLYAAYFFRNMRNASKGNFPPSPKEDSILGNIGFFKRMPNTLHQVLFEEMREKHGPLVHLRLVNQHIYVVSDPHLINQVLKGDYYHYPRPCLTLTIGKFAILSVEGEVWKRHRKIISSCLTRERVKGYVEDVITKTDVFVEKLRQADNGTADFAKLITTLTVEVFVKAVYNYEMNLFDKPDDKLFQAIEDSLVLSKELPYEELPSLWWITHPFLMSRFTRGKNYVNAYLDKLIAQYRDPNCVVDRTNLVATLIDSCDKEGIKLTADEIRDETFIMFYAGFETTFATILWTLYHLSRHPDEQAKVQKELDEVLGDGKAIEYEQLAELKYLNAAIKETLRITPVAVATCRQAISDHTLGGFDVPKDSVMILNFFGLHHDKVYWENPSSFNIDRWIDQDYKDLQLMYLPFGGGKRACAGQKFAEMELRIMLAKMLQSFNFSATKEPKSEQILTWVIKEMELDYKPRELPVVAL